MTTNVKDDFVGEGHMHRPGSSLKRQRRWWLAAAALVGLGLVACGSYTHVRTDLPEYYDCHTDARPWGNSTTGQDISVTLMHGQVVDLLRAYTRPSPIETKHGSDGFTFSLVEIGKYFRHDGVNQRLAFTCTPIDFSED